MLDFFRKRFGKAPADTARTSTVTHPAAIAEVTVPDRQIAMSQAHELAGDEAAAVEFLLNCGFADARLVAAKHIHSKPMAERVLAAMRNVDRRVAKMMQARLEVCRQWEADEQRATYCVTEAGRLGATPYLTPNQVADLDKQWQQIQHAAPPLVQAFEEARARLQARLVEQVRLQRAVADALSQLRAWMQDTGFLLSDDAAQKLSVVQQAVKDDLANSSETASLPKHLVPEFEQAAAECAKLRQRLQQCQEGIVARQNLLEEWEAADPSALKEELILRQWRAFPPLPDEAAVAPLQTRVDALIGKIKAVQQPAPSVVVKQKSKGEEQKQFAETLTRLEQALQDGALQLAAEQNKLLQQLETDGNELSTAQASLLAKLRAELAHLQGWARWGASVSREELLHTAENLPMQALAPVELAKKVGSLRERWKLLDTTAGGGTKELWQRFDQACNTAYAPAAAYFQQLAAEREQNAVQAQALIDECQAYAHAFAQTAPAERDWKAVTAFLDRVRQSWYRMGTIERKERKRLETAFNEALQGLSEALAEQRRHEVKQREQLIEAVAQLDPYARQTFDTLRQLQERWQQQAKMVPLERRQEQQLWQRFRAQCDQVFATRKEASLSADRERREHLQQKEALCSRLEAALGASSEAIQTLLQETRQAWNQIGPVPRNAEREIEKRYQQAEQNLQQQLEYAKRQVLAGKFLALQAKLHLCQALEQQLAPAAELTLDSLQTMQTQWETLPATVASYERVLQARFEAAVAAVQAKDRAYGLTLERNKPVVLHELLRLEILAGLDSPAELSRERLQLQVDVLQSSLKTGKAGKKRDVPGEEGPLLTLCRLPALIDAEAGQRIDRILTHYQSVYASS